MGDEFSHAHAACLAAQLPKGARCRVADDPHEEWGTEAWMLRNMEHSLDLLRWCFLKYENEPQPSPRPYPGKARDDAAAEARMAANRTAVDAAFGMNGGEDGD